MIVHQFNTFPYGGAAAAARRLHEQLNRSSEPVTSRFFYHRDDRDTPLDQTWSSCQFAPRSPASWWEPVRQRLDKRRRRRVHSLFDRHLAGHDSGGEVFSMPLLPDETPLRGDPAKADLVHLHWVSFFIDYPSFFGSLPVETPIVWTLHDMNPFTGGCHYAGHCSRFKTGCGNCPQIREPGEHDLSRVALQVKRQALQGRQIHVVTPSHWMKELAAQSPVWPTGTSFQVIHLGFDLEALCPMRKEQARAELGLPPGPVRVAFGAEDIRNRRKGFPLLLSALRELSCHTPVECLVFGAGEIPDDPNLPPMRSFGFVSEVALQRKIYSAADIVVVPSLEDNQPQVGLEAMACGTPVVGFDAGGIPEYVREGVNGCLARQGDVTDLACKISRLADDPQAREVMGRRARSMMENEFELGAQTRKHVQLYNDILYMNEFQRDVA